MGSKCNVYFMHRQLLVLLEGLHYGYGCRREWLHDIQQMFVPSLCLIWKLLLLWVVFPNEMDRLGSKGNLAEVTMKKDYIWSFVGSQHRC